MQTLDQLKIGADKLLTTEKWDALVEKVEALSLTIPDNENGVLIKDLTLGTKPGNPNDNTFIDYPWEHETLGVTQKNFNLRLQSPKGVYIHTGITSNEGTSDKWWDKVRLSIKQDGKVGIGTSNPVSYPLDIVAPATSGILLSSKSSSHSTEIKMFTQRDDMGQHVWGSNGGGTTGKGNKAWMLQAIHERHADQAQKGNFRIYYHNDAKWIQALCIQKETMNVGIGTNNPEAKLEVDGTAQAFTIKSKYLEPDFKEDNYEFVNLGVHGAVRSDGRYKSNDAYFAGFMRNRLGNSGFGKAEDFTIFTYNHRNINLKPYGTGATNIMGKLLIDGSYGIEYRRFTSTSFKWYHPDRLKQGNFNNSAGMSGSFHATYTKFDADEWNAGIVGFDTGVSDWKENHSGVLFRMKMVRYQVKIDGKLKWMWFALTWVRHHERTPKWEVFAIFTKKKISRRIGF